MRKRSRLPVIAALIAPALVACSLLTDYDLGSPKATPAAPDGSIPSTDTGAQTDAETKLEAGAAQCTETPCVVQLVTGGLASCARLASGEVWCWGSNATGVVGASTPGNNALPVRVTFDGPVTDLFMGTWGRWPFACAHQNGILQCWGDDGGNKAMKLGRGVAAGEFVPVPAPVVGLPTADEVALGGDRACARVGNGLSCWGMNYNTPPTVDSAPTTLAVPKPVKHIVMGREQVCALLDSDEVACAGHLLSCTEGWKMDGGSPGQPTMEIVQGVSGVAEMSEASAHICVLKKGGAILCWGRDTFGQLGRGTTGGTSMVPAPVPLPALGKAIAAGANHTCALLVDDTVWCWGRNESNDGDGLGKSKATPRGQAGGLPDGGVDSANPVPRKIEGLPSTPLVSIVASYDHSCALTASGAVYCWGSNTHGQLGRGKEDGGAPDNAPHPTAARVLF